MGHRDSHKDSHKDSHRDSRSDRGDRDSRKTRDRDYDRDYDRDSKRSPKRESRRSDRKSDHSSERKHNSDSKSSSRPSSRTKLTGETKKLRLSPPPKKISLEFLQKNVLKNNKKLENGTENDEIDFEAKVFNAERVYTRKTELPVTKSACDPIPTVKFTDKKRCKSPPLPPA